MGWAAWAGLAEQGKAAGAGSRARWAARLGGLVHALAQLVPKAASEALPAAIRRAAERSRPLAPEGIPAPRRVKAGPAARRRGGEGADAGSVCPDLQVPCGQLCIEVLTSAANCGACNNACPARATCVAGKCVCPEGETSCDGKCVDMQTSTEHCGACGVSCRGGTCTKGECACPKGNVNCEGQCVDLTTSAAHCGSCVTACANNHICAAGLCTCATGLNECGETCVDVLKDKANCGECDKACPADKVCAGGTCVCAPGQTECSGKCTDLARDAAHCGTCTNACMGAIPCLKGICGCPAGQELCGTTCVDLSNDPAHCGSCVNACATAQFCTDGKCLKSPCDGLCTGAEQVLLAADGFREENFGTTEHCYEVQSYEPTETNPRIICWNFSSSRTLIVNGAVIPCTADAGQPLTKKRAGGYCVQVGRGGNVDAGFLFPIK